MESEEPKYLYRIEFAPMKILDESDWKERRIPTGHLGRIYFQDINLIGEKRILEELLNEVANRIKVG